MGNLSRCGLVDHSGRSGGFRCTTGPPGLPETGPGSSPIGDLPPAARDYVHFVERVAGAPVSFVSVGPDRAQTVVLPAKQTA